MSYRTGDHLAVYARNRPEVVDSIIERLGLRADQVVVLDGQGSRMRHLPIGKPVTVRQLLTDFVELQDAASRADVRTLIESYALPGDHQGAAPSSPPTTRRPRRHSRATSPTSA